MSKTPVEPDPENDDPSSDDAAAAVFTLPQKVYFRIGEVARLLGVASHVIRFWETEFRSLRPQKSASGQRVYTRRDVERLSTIKHLLREERYTIEGARRHLREHDPDTTPGDRADAMRARLVAARARLVAALQAIDPDDA
jgi:DNA-binding transcriptional MerR regulator